LRVPVKVAALVRRIAGPPADIFCLRIWFGFWQKVI
jgi:hypothetical protein